MAATPPSHGAHSDNIMATSGPANDNRHEQNTTSRPDPVPSAWAMAFNNPGLSDIKIRQFCNGHMRIYHAHKYILRESGSEWFRQLILRHDAERSRAESTPSAQRSTDPWRPHSDIIDLHDDDPVHFELLLKWLYTREWDRDVEAQRGFYGEPNSRSKAFVAVGVYALAEKYNVPSLRDRAYLEMSSNPCLFYIWARGGSDMVNLVIIHCVRCLWTECDMCDLIWNAFLWSPEARDVGNLLLLEREFREMRLYYEWLLAVEEWEAWQAAWLQFSES